MSFLLNTLLIVGVFYLAGRIMFAHNERKHLSVIHVLVSFVGIMLVNALIMALLLIALFAVSAAIVAITNSDDGMLFDSTGRLKASNMLVAIFVLIFATAFIHYALRKPLLKRHALFQLGSDEYQIFEYFIQWVTIYLVVYQCFFEGFRSFVTWYEMGDTTLKSIFEVALTPTNLNLVIQPLLIASWVLVVLERFARQNDPEDTQLLAATFKKPGPYRPGVFIGKLLSTSVYRQVFYRRLKTRGPQSQRCPNPPPRFQGTCPGAGRCPQDLCFCR